MSKSRTRRQRRLAKMRLRTGKKIALHNNPNGRTGKIHSTRLKNAKR